MLRRVVKHLDAVYLKNRLVYTFLDSMLLSGGHPDELSPEVKAFRQEELFGPKIHTWDVRALPIGVATEHPDMPGLWMMPSVLSSLEIDHIHDFLAHVTRANSVQGENGVPIRSGGLENKFLEWFEYHPGRWMLPLQPHPEINEDIARLVLSDMQSTNNTDPMTWPNLKTLWDSAPETSHARYAEQIIKIQETVTRLVPDVGDEPCLFIQMQRLERGSRVGKHFDDFRKGGKIISTAVLQGENIIRVGHIQFKVLPGDVYALARNARYDVKHEVLPDPDDRLSATIRFGNTVS
ncbi:hypothetical protein CYMTET_45275 [Cymbomonas tetramitiformis]|uniref:Uncharacterized protein n=1 Tax=Cymbomonas tetramitiformis TaxID=36881 RepID=A0AAE0C0L9_9CHLO|nr:hypothetical protein CYMTET_45275 [Cymbomonas tetramitiformis]